MIILHIGEDASARALGAVAGAKGAVFHRDPEVALEKSVELIGAWLADQKKTQLATSEPAVIVMDPAEAEDESQLEALMSLRRMSRWVGVDIHLVGSLKAKPAADKVVKNQAELEAAQQSDHPAGGNPDPVNDPPMEPFRRVKTEVPTWRELMAVSGYPEQRAKEEIEQLEKHEIWANNIYQVNIGHADPKDTGGVGFAHLIIRRLDRRAIHSWSHFQAIKNELVGPECEAVEMYPAEKHLIDAKDHYHLWAFTSPDQSFGIGFLQGRQVKNRD